MAQFNIPVVTKIWDKDYEAVIKITGQYNASQNASNTLILQANTLKGANSSQLCMVDVNHIDFATSISNGFISIEFISANTSNIENSTVFTVGKRNCGELACVNFNPLGANATGDINLYTSALDANDSFTLIMYCRKSVSNTPSAWSNVENQPPNTYY